VLYAVPLARMWQDALRAAVEGLAEEGRELRAQVATTLQQVICRREHAHARLRLPYIHRYFVFGSYHDVWRPGPGTWAGAGAGAAAAAAAAGGLAAGHSLHSERASLKQRSEGAEALWQQSSELLGEEGAPPSTECRWPRGERCHHT
jgi:hypothetical protein